MRIRQIAPAAAALLAFGAAGCSADKILTATPTTAVAADAAINDPVSAAAAVAGIYDDLQGTGYYGEDFVLFGDLASDNASHTGTFSTFRSVDLNNVLADNSSIAGIWQALYATINDANSALVKLASAPYLADATRRQYLGEAYFLRALSLHNATKYWGAVPVVLAPVGTPAEAATVTRADTATVYKQILADLDSSEKYIGATKDTRRANVAAVRAIRARVKLYRADWAGALAAAQSVDSQTVLPKLALATSFGDLFSTNGSNTTEDIFRVRFNDTDQNSASYYYFPKTIGGRYEVAPTADLQSQFTTGDQRLPYTVQTLSNRLYGSKFRSVSGTEHLHAIRYAEVVLIEAEALARLGRLTEAAAQLNKVRARAGIAPFVVGLTTQTQTLVDAIVAERRVELALEGDRWADMIRTGQAATFLAAKKASASQALYPVPQRDRDVAPGLTQNPGY